jgi:hypothetical protein
LKNMASTMTNGNEPNSRSLKAVTRDPGLCPYSAVNL